MDRKDLALKFWDRSGYFSTEEYKEYARNFLLQKIREDVGKKDLTADALNTSEKHATAEIIAKEEGIVAGLEEISLLPGIQMLFNKKDGDPIKKGESILTLKGNLRTLLSYERTMVNCLKRMSGIATATQNLRNRISKACHVLGTRKTLWGTMDKKAMHIGGALTHRLALDDGILIKENYLEKDIKKTLEAISKNADFIEIEVRTKEHALDAAETVSGLNRNVALLLDNLPPQTIKEVISKINSTYRNILLEASGNITDSNITEYAETGVDAVSLGFLTHSVKALNLSMRMVG